jgi:6-phosphogluconolactonase (cycloisomerase 2 family)
MKFTKFGKALLMSALTAGVIFGITSCIQDYTVGYLYVTGTVTAQSSSEGIITGLYIDHNTGKLNQIHGMPISSGGANPVRAVLTDSSRFLYVLNRGTNASGGSVCTTADPCQNSNITQFAVGGNGILTAQQTFYTQGINPFRIVVDSSGSYLYVLDHDAPLDTGSTSTRACITAFATPTCGDVTAFQINQTTGRLQLIVNAQVTSASGAALPYFPVPANPIDFLWISGDLLTLSGTPTSGDSVFPYTYNESSGQLTVNQNSSQSLNIYQATAIVGSNTYVYVLDNEAPNPNPTGAVSQILPFTIGNGGALTAQIGGIVPDDPSQSNPIYLMVESKGKWVYVANQGNNLNTTNAQSGIAGYVIDPSTRQLSFIAGEPFGAGAGPQCLVEDPSNQYIYTANFNDSTVTGMSIDQNAGVLRNLNTTGTYSLTGPATWCLVNGRTD